ncbi:MAG: hypothetical protein A2Y38_15880 [Spirochaetes bacterium GWB1_59_5]|nr:MAG: hypothetical protein A2Y38_15880 [Spirochaetes bacterium GWB1_59_5]
MQIVNASDAPLPGQMLAHAKNLYAQAKLLATRPAKRVSALASDIGDVFIFVARLGSTEAADQVAVIKSGYVFRVTGAGNDEVNGPWLTWEGGIAPFQVQLCYRDPEFGDYTYPMTDYVVNFEAALMDAAGNLEFGQTYYLSKLVEEDPWWADDLLQDLDEGDWIRQSRIGLLVTDDTGRQIFAPFTPNPEYLNSPVGLIAAHPLRAVYTHYGPPTNCTPVIVWANPADILGGAPLSATELNAAVKIPGTVTDLPGAYTYDPPLETVLEAGPHALFVNFQATDVLHYLPATASVTINVGKAAQTITVVQDHWDDVLGDPYQGATPDTPLVGNTSHGAHGDDLFVGGTGVIQATCTSGQAVNYFSSNPEVATIDILSGAVTLISRGEVDSGVFFSIVAPENDNFLEAVYTGQTHNFSLLQLDPADITFTINTSPIEYGEALEVTTTAPIAGTWWVDPEEGSILDRTTTIPHSITAVFTPEDVENYAMDQTFDLELDVTAATPTITWAPLDMVYGDTFGAMIMNAVATNPHTGLEVAGDYVYYIYDRENVLGTEDTTSVDNTGADLLVDFTPTGPSAANHTTATATRTLVIGTKGLQITALAASKVYGAADPVFAYLTAGLVGDETAVDNLTGYLSRASGEASGTYAITVGTLTGNQNYHVESFTSADFTITPGNRAPVTSSLVKTSGNYRGESIVLTATATDPESDPITFTWTYTFNGSAYTGVHDGSNVGGFTPSLPGVYYCSVQAADGVSAYSSAVKYLNVTIPNRTSAANFTSSHTGDFHVGDSTTLTSTTPADPDGDSQTLVFTVESCPTEGDPLGSMVEVSTGVATFTPDAAGAWVVKLTVTDAQGGVSSALMNLTILAAVPTLAWGTIAGMTYGNRLDASRLNASTGAAGTFVYTVGGVTVASGAAGALTFYPAGGFLPPVGSLTVDVAFTPENSWEYDFAEASQTVTVSKKSLTVTATGTTRYYTGAAFSGGFGASYDGFIDGEYIFSLSGSLVYGGSSQGASNVGSYAITPSGWTSASYDISYVSGTLTILRGLASPGAAFSLPAFVVAGVALGSVLANASSASVAGTWAYVGESGTLTSASVLSKDTGYSIDATFTPTSNLYAVTTITDGFVVKGVPVITWGTPEAITYGDLLSGTQLNAAADVAGFFEYDPLAGVTLPAGEQALAVYFTPADTANYTDATDGVWLTVNKAVPEFTFTINVSSILVGGTLAGKYTLVNPQGGAVTYRLDSAVGTLINIDTYVFAAADSGRWVFVLCAATTNYLAAEASDGVAILAPAEITWATPASIVYGTALSGTQLNASATVAGTLVYDPPAGTILDAGEQALGMTFTPSDPILPPVSDGVWLTVTQAVGLEFSIDVDSIPLNGTLAGKYTLVNPSGVTPLAYYQKANYTWATFNLNTFVFTENRTSMTVTVAVAAGPNYTDTVKSDTVRVGGLPQTIGTISITGDIVNKKGGGYGIVSATASSGLPVTFTANNSNVFLGSLAGGNILSIVPGQYTVTANQPGDSTYAAAPPKSVLLTVMKLPQPLDFTLNPSIVGIGGASQITVTNAGYGTGALSVYSNYNPYATVSGWVATGQGEGDVWITLTKQADAVYEGMAMARLLSVRVVPQTPQYGWVKKWTNPRTNILLYPLYNGGGSQGFIVSYDGMWMAYGALTTILLPPPYGSTGLQMNQDTGWNFSDASFPFGFGGGYAYMYYQEMYHWELS